MIDETDDDILQASDSAIFAPSNAGSARLAEGRRRGIILLKAALSDPEVATAARMAVGVAPPEPGRIAIDGENGALRLGADELLLITPYAEVGAKTKFLRETIGGGRGAAADMSDAYIVSRLTGPAAREALATLAPLDMHPRGFSEGMAAQTRIGAADCIIAQISASPEQFEIFAPRSFADHVWDLLSISAARAGRIGLFSGGKSNL